MILRIKMAVLLHACAFLAHVLLGIKQNYVYHMNAYAYERLNGFLSDIPNNNQNIELQIMNKFLQQFSSQVVDIDISSVTKGDVSVITKGSESDTSFSDSLR